MPWPVTWLGRPSRAFAVHRKSGPLNAPIGPNFTRILTLTVPAGCYAVFGKTEIQTNTRASADCMLGYDDGSGIRNPDETAETPGTDSVSGMSAAVHNLESLVEVKNSATIWIEARATQAWGAIDSKLIAIEVQCVSDQEVTS